MRKKFIKSSRPTYKKRIKKAQQGMRFVSYNPVSNPTIDYTDITNPINPFSEYNYNTVYNTPEALVVPVRDTDESDVVANNPTVEPVINKPVASKVTYTPKSYKGLAAFNKAYDEVEASNPEAKKYRQFLTKMAEQESGFNSAIQNRAGAPAYGYFQFMQDDKKYNNIRQYAGTDIETFRNNPKLQIEAAIKLAKSFEKGFSKEDLELANKNGYSTWGLLGGAWLAGNGGVRKFLRGQGNPSDRHWSKEGKGTDVATRIKAFNFKEGGIIKYQNPSSGIRRLSQEAVADSLNYGWEGQDNFSRRRSRYTNVDPTGNFYSPGDWISNGWRTLWDSSRDNKGTPHEEALYLRYLGGKRDATQLPQTSIRFSRDYDITDNAYPNKEYVGIPKEQKDAIRDNVVTNMQSELREGVWVQVKDNVRRSRDQRGTGNALSGLGKFGLRNNNNSGIFDIADTYDYPSWIPIPDRNKGYELEIRDTIWTKDAKPELYKVENGYLPYNASPLQKWAKKEVDKLIELYK